MYLFRFEYITLVGCVYVTIRSDIILVHMDDSFESKYKASDLYSLCQLCLSGGNYSRYCIPPSKQDLAMSDSNVCLTARHPPLPIIV